MAILELNIAFHIDFESAVMVRTVLGLLLIVVTSCQANDLATPSTSLNFKDEGLAECVAQQLVKAGVKSPLALTELKCHGKNIKELNGLEALTRLEYLSLFNNGLTSVDLSSLKRLTYLNLANNRLKSVEIAGLSKLETLYLFKNKLETIDFSGLKRLKKIRITNNKLRNIDISPLVALEKGYFFDNQLEDLALTGLANLSFIELRQNPMPDEVYDRYDAIEGVTIVHDGNADDWK